MSEKQNKQESKKPEPKSSNGLTPDEQAEAADLFKAQKAEREQKAKEEAIVAKKQAGFAKAVAKKRAVLDERFAKWRKNFSEEVDIAKDLKAQKSGAGATIHAVRVRKNDKLAQAKETIAKSDLRQIRIVNNSEWEKIKNQVAALKGSVNQISEEIEWSDDIKGARIDL